MCLYCFEIAGTIDDPIAVTRFGSIQVALANPLKEFGLFLLEPVGLASCGGAFNLGYIDLGSTRASGNSSTTYAWNATIAWDPATGTLTVTIGTLTSGTTPVRVMSSVKARYTPSPTLTDPLGTPIAGTALYARKLF